MMYESGNEICPTNRQLYKWYVDENSDDTNDEPMKTVIFRKEESQCCSKQINVSHSVQDIHLGTQFIFNGPVNITGVTKDDIIMNNQNPNNILMDCEVLTSNEKELSRTAALKKFLFEKCSVKFCIILCAIIIFLEIVMLTYYYYNNKEHLQNKQTLWGLEPGKFSEMNKKLRKSVLRKFWGLDTDCSFNCLKTKSKVRFALAESIWFDLHDENGGDSRTELNNLFNNFRNYSNQSFDDIYYNYIIDVEGYIFEGRSLACPFDEPFLPDNHSSTITVGISYCLQTNSYQGWPVQLQYEAITELLNKLKRYNILDEGFIVEFPSVCKDTLLYNRVHQTWPIKLYENDFFHNVTKSTGKMIKNILFLSDNTNVSSTEPVILFRRNTDNSKLFENETCNNSTNTTGKEIYRFNFDSITVRFLLKDYSCIITPINECKNVRTCWNTLSSIIDKTHNSNILGANYILFARVSFEIVPLVCSLESQKLTSTPIINIIIYQSAEHEFEYEKGIKTFSSILEPIIEDISSRIKYNKVQIEFVCNDKLAKRFINLYQTLADVKYVEKDSSGKFFAVKECSKSSETNNNINYTTNNSNSTINNINSTALTSKPSP